MQRCAAFRDIKISIAFHVKRRNINPKTKQTTQTRHICISCKLRQQRSTPRKQLLPKLRLLLRDSANRITITLSASRNQSINPVKLKSNATPLKELQNITSAAPRSNRERRSSIARLHSEIRAMVQKQLNHL
jgi:hypothetical protein